MSRAPLEIAAAPARSFHRAAGPRRVAPPLAFRQRGGSVPRSPVAFILRGWRPLERRPEPHLSLAALLSRLADRLSVWQERRRSRGLLLTLDERALHDFGIDRARAEQEWDRPFWRG